MIYFNDACATDFYTDAGVTATKLDTGDTSYNPILLFGQVGYVINSNLAVETYFGTNVYSKEKEGTKFKIRNLTGLFLRYGTSIHRKIRVYGAAGGSYAHLDIKNDRGTIRQEYKDFSYAIGIEERFSFRSLKDLSLTLEYANYIDSDQDDMVIQGISLGLSAPIKF